MAFGCRQTKSRTAKHLSAVFGCGEEFEPDLRLGYGIHASTSYRTAHRHLGDESSGLLNQQLNYTRMIMIDLSSDSSTKRFLTTERSCAVDRDLLKSGCHFLSEYQRIPVFGLPNPDFTHRPIGDQENLDGQQTIQ